MFDAIRFRNFKCLGDLRVELGRLTLLVGANASGKSSVLDGLDLLCQLARPSVNEAGPRGRAARLFSGARDPSRLRTYGAEAPLLIAAERGGRTALSVEASPLEGEDGFTRYWLHELSATHGDEETVTVHDGGDDADLRRFFGWLDYESGYGSTVRLRLDAARVAAFAPDAVQPRVKSDGAGTPAVLAWLAEQRSPALEAIEADVRRVVPRAKRLMPERVTQRVEGGIDQLGRRFSMELDNGDRVPADLLSEGTLLTIGLVTVLRRPPVPRLVLLDDFDRALHPTAQRQLVETVKQVLASDLDLQLVCTTHSPYVLDLFEADEVRVLRADAAGRTHARRLTEHPEWNAWKGTMKAAEFWSYVGEDWLDGASDAG